jgi:hypothetical protein
LWIGLIFPIPQEHGRQGALPHRAEHRDGIR